ncbi:MAG: prepilin-type N-terminal cleavage/methylation domain-containing protein [Chitinispirillales bacterium]|jgi:prepilin-type N-terminal cleavage/methylation domain-containing protein|nr:prepilin-type N-terminal cleavage/methylation domain-containing protein [Chitinispirillales bacterium]
MNKLNKKGFTLVEVVITAVLLSVLVLGGYALFMMYLRSQAETVAHLKMQRQCEALMDEISRSARGSNLILNGNSAIVFTLGTNPNIFTDTEHRNTNSILMYDVENANVTGFRFNNGIVETTDDGAIWTPFTIVGDTLFLNEEQPSGFLLNRSVASIVVTVSLMTVSGGNTYTLTVERGAFRCKLPYFEMNFE